MACAVCVCCGAQTGAAGALERFPCKSVAALPLRAALALCGGRFGVALAVADARVRERVMAAGGGGV